jgi:hypothetical protein
MKLSLETMVSSIGRKVMFFLNASKRIDMGASVIDCCEAARRTPQIGKLIARAVSKSANMTFVDARKSSLDEKICLNVRVDITVDRQGSVPSRSSSAYWKTLLGC